MDTATAAQVAAALAEEYPDGDASSTEAYASLVRTGTALLQELDRCMSASFDLPQPAATALAVIDGAGEALTPTQISERVLIASATMTSFRTLRKPGSSTVMV